VSSDWENRVLAGKFSDPWKKTTKKWEIAGNFAKRRKTREFPFNYIIFEKEKLRSPFLLFFQGKTKPFF